MGLLLLLLLREKIEKKQERKKMVCFRFVLWLLDYESRPNPINLYPLECGLR